MSKLAHSCQATMDAIEFNALLNDGCSQDEAFEIMHEAGMENVTWCRALNDEYMQWIYINIK